MAIGRTAQPEQFPEWTFLTNHAHVLIFLSAQPDALLREVASTVGIKGLKSPMAAVFRLAQPIGFDAPDDAPVNLMIFLLVPEAATQKHLEILSEIAEMLSDANLRAQLGASADAMQLHQLIVQWQSAQVV